MPCPTGDAQPWPEYKFKQPTQAEWWRFPSTGSPSGEPAFARLPLPRHNEPQARVQKALRQRIFAHGIGLCLEGERFEQRQRKSD